MLLLALAVLAGGCSHGPVDITRPRMDDVETRACAALVEELPAELVEQRRREPAVGYGAAWGDPPIVLRCGVDEPAGFEATSACQIVNGVAWFIPDEQITGEPEDLVMTTVGRTPTVEVALPSAYFPPAAAMAQLAGPVANSTTEVEPCG